MFKYIMSPMKFKVFEIPIEEKLASGYKEFRRLGLRFAFRYGK